MCRVYAELLSDFLENVYIFAFEMDINTFILALYEYLLNPKGRKGTGRRGGALSRN